MPGSHFTRGFASELHKVAARAGLKMIRRMVDAGEMGKAERLAITPGVLKKTKAGSQIKHLGSGMEGTSTLIAHPKKGLAVRKIYDPKGVSGPEMIARKAAVGRQLSDSPDAAHFLGETKTRIGPAHFYEHVPGKTLNEEGIRFSKGTPKPDSEPSTAPGKARARIGTAKSMIDSHEREASARMKRLKKRGEKAGVDLGDLHEGNVITGKDGHSRAVDYLPTEDGKPDGLRDEAFKNPDVDYLTNPKRPGNLMARAFRGAPPIPPTRKPISD
jgi:hypothetical protein